MSSFDRAITKKKITEYCCVKNWAHAHIQKKKNSMYSMSDRISNFEKFPLIRLHKYLDTVTDYIQTFSKNHQIVD